MKSRTDRAVDLIVKVADVKMKLNSYKGQIESIDDEALLRGAHGEVEELKAALQVGDPTICVIEEAADVLNFLAAIVARAAARYEGRKKGE
jgi:hypothetical protein